MTKRFVFMNPISISAQQYSLPVSGVQASSPAAQAAPAAAANEAVVPSEVFSMSESSEPSAARPVLVASAPEPSPASEAPAAPAASSMLNGEVVSSEARTLGVAQGASVLPPAQGAVVANASSLPEDSLISSAKEYYTNVSKCEPGISSMMKGIAEDEGMGMEGFQFRLKGWDSFVRKVKAEPDSVINDVVRYTLTAPPESLADKALESMASMEKKGYKTVVVKNTWDVEGAGYRGINTTVKSLDGVLFEVQYHTPESYAMKDKTHKLYEEWRVIDPESPRALEIMEQQVEMTNSLTRPDHVERVVPFKLEV